MLKQIILLLFIGITQKVIAQKSTIIGMYSTSMGSNQQATAAIFVLDNNNFLEAYFGGMRKGTWKIIKDSLVEFKYTDIPASPFTLFGRQNKNIGDSVRMFFEGFNASPAAFHFGNLKCRMPLMTKVFNDDANCISFPNV